MDRYSATLDWIAAQHGPMRELVCRWASINSGTHNLPGIEKLTAQVRQAFGVLGGEQRLVGLSPYQSVGSDGQPRAAPLAKAIHIVKRPEAPLRVFLGIHMDTVYAADHPFQSVEMIDANTLRGPGVCDAKGGLAVMLIALEALERSGLAGRLGWEVLINPDEEIGSPGSAPLLAQAAARNHLGLVFEPALPGGAIASARSGSARYAAVVRGKSAHVGRGFHDGRNAIHALAKLICALNEINRIIPGAIVSVGQVEGGGPVNVVPDLAICRFNLRAPDPMTRSRIDDEIQRVIAQSRQSDGITVDLHGGWTAPPKPLDDGTQALLQHLAACGRDLGLSIQWQPTGGVCDGNKLAAAGLTTIDSLGPRGGDIHSPDEYVLLDSLTERAKLAALLLMKLAGGEVAWPTPSA